MREGRPFTGVPERVSMDAARVGWELRLRVHLVGNQARPTTTFEPWGSRGDPVRGQFLPVPGGTAAALQTIVRKGTRRLRRDGESGAWFREGLDTPAARCYFRY